MAKRDASQQDASIENAVAELPVEQETLLVAALNHALESEANFIGQYDAALRKVKVEEVGTRLREFRKDHVERVLQIRGVLDQMGAPVLAEERPTPVGIGIARTLEEAPDEDALMLDFVAGEDFSRRLYHWMSTLEAPEPIQRLAQRALDEEERHYKFAAELCGLDVVPLG